MYLLITLSLLVVTLSIIEIILLDQLFDKWLRDQDDFDFVIDAANVAYYNQNFKKGKFSYQQVGYQYQPQFLGIF